MKKLREMIRMSFIGFMTWTSFIMIFGNSNYMDDKSSKEYRKEEPSTKSKNKGKTNTLNKDGLSKDNKNPKEPTTIVSATEKASVVNKKEKYSIHDLYLINTKLIDGSIGQKYYLVKETGLGKNSLKHIKCTYNTNKKASMECYSFRYKTLDKENPATFRVEYHYSDIGNQYFCVKANIHDKKYKRVYKLEPGTIDHNPSNKKKFERFENTISTFLEATDSFDFDVLKDHSYSEWEKSNYYTADEIGKISEKINKGKVKVKMR